MVDEIEAEVVVVNSAVTERREKYDAGMRMAEGGLRQAATAFLEMEKAGDDVSFIRSGLRQMLRAIAGGRMLPEVYNFGGGLRQRLMSMPIAIQEMVVKGDPLPLVVLKDGEGIETLRVPALRLLPKQLQQVFGDDHVRTEGEQRVWLEAQKLGGCKKSVISDPVVVNRKRGGIEVGNIFISKQVMLTKLMELE